MIWITDVLLVVCQSLVCMARGSTRMRRSGRNTKSQGVQGPRERSGGRDARACCVLEPACAEPASPVRYRRVISARSKEARGGALHRSPRQSRENMKQVSVRSIFGSSTHHPCLSTLGGRSRHIHAMRWRDGDGLSAGAGAGAGQTEGVAAALSGRNRAGLGQSGCDPGALGASVFPVWGMSSRAVERSLAMANGDG